MSKDAPITAASQVGTNVIGGISRARTSKTIVAFGVAGLAVGVLNLAAVTHGWTLQSYFDVLDFPVISLLEPYNGLYYRGWFTSCSGGPMTVLAYWSAIGLLLGWIFCLARAGIIRDIACEKICRWVLLAGACGGALIGSLDFLAASNGWDYLGSLFESFNRPASTLVDILQVRFQSADSRPASASTVFMHRHVAGVVYWMIIGLLLASLFCIVRILAKRKGKTFMPAESSSTA